MLNAYLIIEPALYPYTANGDEDEKNYDMLSGYGRAMLLQMHPSALFDLP